MRRLAARKLANNLALLDRCRTATGREQVSQDLGIPLGDLTALVHKADLSRRMGVAHSVCYITEAGYTTYQAVRAASSAEYRERVHAAIARHGATQPGWVDGYPEYARAFPEIVT